MASKAPASKAGREKKNWLINLLYVRQEFKECMEVIEEQLRDSNGMCEYAIYVKALIKRQEGQVQESLQLFQAATCISPLNVYNLKQMGRSLYLLGKHRGAIEVYDEAQKISPDDWEIWHNKGLCHMYLRHYDSSIECFSKANAIQRHDVTFMQLGKVYALQEDYKSAIDVYTEALEFSPEHAELLTTLGILYLRMGENFKAFDYLGNALTHDPKNAKTILAAGSIIQDHSDMDVALIKYRVAAVHTPNSAQLWNNIGMCFFGKTKYVAAIACLKRALYLDPFEWIISYNLGLVHLNTGQFASAFHFFSASINLKPDFPSSYMYLAITLSRLDDFSNACSAYEKAIEMDSDHMFHLNFAITLFNHGDVAEAKRQFDLFNDSFQLLDEEQRNSDPEVNEQRQLLQRAAQTIMVKRALCVGCNYPSKAFGLAGAVNDAFLIAETLQAHMGFRHENICVLHDVYPGQKKSLKVEPAKCPTRVNILQQLQQMVRLARPGDVLFFSFSGYGLQVDDMDGYQDEGYDEAILPTDFVDGRDGDYSVICTNDIHDVLLGVPSNVVVTAVMDCDHATTLIDVGGTLDGSLVSGLKFSNFCGLKAHSAKMTLANHERDVWQEERARSVKARPRFQPVMEIDNPRKGRLPTRPAMSRSSGIAFCYSAAGHGQTAMELQMTLPGVDGQEPTIKQHGVLSWCFAKALEELSFDGTYFELKEEIQQQMRHVKDSALPRMDQEVLMTFAVPLSKPRTMKVLQPLGSMQTPDRGISTQSMRLAAPAVVPPPPPGFLAGGSAIASRQPSEDAPSVHARPPWSDLVHHNVEGREGSFKVQGVSYTPQRDVNGHRPPVPNSSAPADLLDKTQPNDRRCQARHADSFGQRSDPGQRQLPEPPPPPPLRSQPGKPPDVANWPQPGKAPDVANWPSPRSPTHGNHTPRHQTKHSQYPGQPRVEMEPGMPLAGWKDPQCST
ncbi:unnamed protein product [Effrenium voratum]|nr:unnamed protein product [Effrenium voratum]